MTKPNLHEPRITEKYQLYKCGQLKGCGPGWNLLETLRAPPDELIQRLEMS